MWMLELASFWGIVWTLGVVFVLCTTVEFEQGTIALCLLVIALVMMYLAGYSDVVTWAWRRPDLAVVFAVLYVAAGVPWAVVKWRFYVMKRAGDAREAYDRQYSRRRNNMNVPSAAVDVDSAPTYRDWLLTRENPLHPTLHRDRIVRWMAWWPLSVLSTLLRDVVIGGWRRLYRLTERVFTAVMQSAAGDGK